MMQRAARTSLFRLRQFYHYLRLFTKPTVFLLLLLLAGSAGYVILEEYPIMDAIYMTVISITTVGFGEIHPLSVQGRLFTIFLILGGVLFYGFAINTVLQIFLERSFKGFMEAQMLRERLKHLSGHYIVCGGGRMALAICGEMSKAGKEFLVVEKMRIRRCF